MPIPFWQQPRALETRTCAQCGQVHVVQLECTHRGWTFVALACPIAFPLDGCPIQIQPTEIAGWVECRAVSKTWTAALCIKGASPGLIEEAAARRFRRTGPDPTGPRGVGRRSEPIEPSPAAIGLGAGVQQVGTAFDAMREAVQQAGTAFAAMGQTIRSAVAPRTPDDLVVTTPWTDAPRDVVAVCEFCREYHRVERESAVNAQRFVAFRCPLTGIRIQPIPRTSMTSGVPRPQISWMTEAVKRLGPHGMQETPMPTRRAPTASVDVGPRVFMDE